MAHIYVKFVIDGTPQTRHLSPVLSVHRLTVGKDFSAMLSQTRCRHEEAEGCQVRLCTATEQEWDDYISPQLHELTRLMGRA